MAILDRIFGIQNRHSSGLVASGISPNSSYWDDGGFKRVFGGWGATSAGQVVNEETCMTLSAFYAGVRLLSSTPAALPLCVYRRTSKEGDKEPAKDHPVYEALHDRPNSAMSPIQFREIGQMYSLLWGRFMFYIQTNRAGRLMGLWPMATNEIRRTWVDGKRVYDVSRVRDNAMFPRPPGMGKTLLENEVGEISPFDGQSVISRAKNQLGESLAAQAFGAGFYGGGAQPYLAIVSKKALTQPAIEKLRENWAQKHGGTVRNVAVLEDELDVKNIGMPLEDAQFLQSRQFYVTEIARWLGIPPHKLYDLIRSTNSNIEEQQLEWYEDLIPHLVRWEQELHWKLFPPSDRKNYLVNHVVENLLRGNIEKRYSAYSTGLQWGFMDRNQVRRLENWNAYEEEANEAMVPSNMIPSSKIGLLQPGGGVGGEPLVGDPSKLQEGVAVGELPQEIQTAEALVLNGAQITAATAIVTAVAAGDIPLDAGIGQLQVLFNLTEQQAKNVMGSAGTSSPTTPNPNPAAQQPAKPKADPNAVDAARSAMKSVVSRMIHKEIAEIRSATKEPKMFVSWLDKFYGSWPVKFAAGIAPAVEVCRAFGYQADATDLSTGHCNRSRAALLELSGRLTASEFAEQVCKEIDKWDAIVADQFVLSVFNQSEKGE